MTLDRLAVDMSKAWEWSQVYIACEFSKRSLLLNMLVQGSKPSKELRWLKGPGTPQTQ
jgi:hypothetical protein